jgi:hypothetical protein
MRKYRLFSLARHGDASISVNISKPDFIAHPAHKCEPLQINIIADHHIYVLDFMA